MKYLMKNGVNLIFVLLTIQIGFAQIQSDTKIQNDTQIQGNIQGDTTMTQPAVPIGPETPKITTRTSLPMGITVAELENGLTVIVQESHVTRVVTVRCFVKNTGSAFEGKYLGTGISHLLEHLVAGGTTTTRTEKEIDALVNQMGGATNAFTGNDMTCYFIDTTAEHAPMAIGLVADAMQHVVFEPSEFEREHKVVQQELNDGENNRRRVIWKMMGQILYIENPIRHPVIGYPDVLRKVTRDDVKAFYTERYVPNNQVFVVVGDVSTDQVLEQVRRAFAGTLRGRDVVIPMPVEPKQVSPREAVREMDGQTFDLVFAWPTVKLSDPDMCPLDVAAMLLTQGESSRMVWDLKYSKQLVLGVGAGHRTPSYVEGAFNVFAAVMPEKLADAQKEILTHVYRLRDEPVTPAELEKAKKQKEAELVFGRQTVQEMALAIGRSYLTTNDPLYDEHYVEQIRNVTAEDIQRAARKYLTPQTLNTILIAPTGMAPKSEEATLGRETEEIIFVTLKNGVRVLVKRQANLPMVTVNAITLGSSLTETAETAGRSTLLAGMLDKGNAKMNAREIATWFDSIGGEFDVTAGRNTIYGNITVLRNDFAPSFRILADSLMTPTFPQQEFDQVRELAVGAAMRRSDNPMQELMETFAQALPASTPYSIIQGGTPESLRRITLNDLVQYHKQHFTPENLLVTVFGDIDAQEVFTLLEDTFGRMPQTVSTSISFERNNQLLNSIEKHKKTGKQTAMVMIGYPIVSISNQKDHAALTVLNAVMSGYDYPGGWLHKELRGEGLVYAVHAQLLTGPAPGFFIIYAETSPEKLPEVIRRIDDNIERAKRGEITPEEFRRTKEMIIAMHAQKNTTIGERSLQAGLDEIYGLGFNNDQTFPARINAVTLEEVSAAAKRFFTKRVLVTTSPDNP